MKTSWHKRAVNLLAGLGLLWLAGAMAAETYRVGGVYPEQGFVVLSDRTFLLASSTRVYRADGSSMSLTDLKKGMSVTIRAQNAAGYAKPVLEEIRIAR
ncbi:MAG: hypothetical protein HZA69_04295 [Gammaproteobacteria bacterium]|nr:hypothetical protein [Gammaproteobacteria bacterium]